MFNTFLYEPLYNILVFLISVLPGHSVGLAIIVLTVVVKLLLLPMTQKSMKSQMMMKKIEPEIKIINKKYKNNKQEQAQQTMDLYKKYGINPFSSCLLTLIQFPVIIALYYVFFKGFNGGINSEILYSFVQYPESINMIFLGTNLAEKSIILAFLAGLTQFFLMKLTMPVLPKSEPISSSKERSFKDDFSRNMSTQMTYMLPIMVFFFAWNISAVISLYWAVSNIFSVVQQLILKRKEGDTLHNLSLLDAR